jgi:putative transposase
VVDPCTREALAIEVDPSLPGARVARVLARIAAERGLPTQIVLDNGPELTGKSLDQWADHHGVERRFIDPGQPLQNAACERCNGRLRDECLNEHGVLGLTDARQIVEAWRQDDHQQRPHSALGYQTPAAVRQHLLAAATSRPQHAGLSSSLDQAMGAGQSNFPILLLH